MILDYHTHTLPSFDDLYREGRNIRLHGNRFIQIDVGCHGQRLHLWSDLIPTAQVVPAPIHDHDYGFQSRVLSGQLINVTYRIADTVPWNCDLKLYNEMAYDIWNVDREKGILVPTDKACILKLLDMAWYRRGMSYRMWSTQLHATAYVGHAITLVDPERPRPRQIRVMVPHRCLPDNLYRRDQWDAAYLWEIVRNIYSGMNKGPLSLEEAWAKLERQPTKVR